MSGRIEPRDDVNPERGEHEYGDVEFADPVNKKYPVDSEKHIRAAWSYIHHKDNADKYRQADAEKIKDNIKKAAAKHGVHLEEHGD